MAQPHVSKVHAARLHDDHSLDTHIHDLQQVQQATAGGTFPIVIAVLVEKLPLLRPDAIRHDVVCCLQALMLSTG